MYCLLRTQYAIYIDGYVIGKNPHKEGMTGFRSFHAFLFGAS